MGFLVNEQKLTTQFYLFKARSRTSFVLCTSWLLAGRSTGITGSLYSQRVLLLVIWSLSSVYLWKPLTTGPGHRVIEKGDAAAPLLRKAGSTEIVIKKAHDLIRNTLREKWDIDQMKPLSATVVLSLLTPSFRRSTASSGRTIKYLRYGFKRWRCHCKLA